MATKTTTVIRNGYKVKMHPNGYLLPCRNAVYITPTTYPYLQRLLVAVHNHCRPCAYKGAAACYTIPGVTKGLATLANAQAQSLCNNAQRVQWYITQRPALCLVRVVALAGW